MCSYFQTSSSWEGGGLIIASTSDGSFFIRCWINCAIQECIRKYHFRMQTVNMHKLIVYISPLNTENVDADYHTYMCYLVYFGRSYFIITT